MSCPYLEEVVMVFCTAYPVRKLVPRNRMAALSPCESEGFGRCPLFREGQRAVAAAAETEAVSVGGEAGEDTNGEVGGGR